MNCDGVSRRTLHFDATCTDRGWLGSCVGEIERRGIVSAPLHLATARGNQQGRAAGIAFHAVDPARLPARSFVPVGVGIASASPELCFVQLAAEAPFGSLVALGFELCGGYSLAPGTERGFVDRAPLTSVEALAAYCEAAEGLRGVKNARRALPYIADGSASPMETALAALLSLPACRGGYGFALPQMNGEIEVPRTMRRAAGADVLRCDLLWPGARVALEYDSDRYHTGARRIARDSTRRGLLKQLDVEVVTVTRRQVVDLYAFEEQVVGLLARLLGRRVRIRCEDFEARRRMLRQELFLQERRL